MTYPETNNHHHYVSVIDGSRYGLLLGPYRTRQDAEPHVERARRKAVELDRKAHFYGFGTCRVYTQHPKPGKLNDLIGLVVSDPESTMAATTEGSP